MAVCVFSFCYCLSNPFLRFMTSYPSSTSTSFSCCLVSLISGHKDRTHGPSPGGCSTFHNPSTVSSPSSSFPRIFLHLLEDPTCMGTDESFLETIPRPCGHVHRGWSPRRTFTNPSKVSGTVTTVYLVPSLETRHPVGGVVDTFGLSVVGVVGEIRVFLNCS